MKWLFFCIILSLIVASNVKAQHNDNSENEKIKRKALGVSSGYFNYASVDKLFASQMYSGGNIFFGVNNAKQKKIKMQTHFRFAFMKRYPDNLDVNQTTVSSDNHLRQKDHLHFEVDDFYFFPIPKFSQGSFEINFLLNWFTSIDLTLNNRMMPEQLLSTAAPGLQLIYGLDNHRFEGRFSTAIISYTCRTNYSNVMIQDYEKFSIWQFVKFNSRIQLPNTLQTFFAGFDYQYKFSNKLSGNVYYNFRYLNNFRPRQLSSVTGIYGIGLIYNY